MSHALRQFEFRELPDIDGNRIEIAFNQALRRCVEDCMDRPGDDKARKITLELSLKPQLDQDGQCEEVEGLIQIKDTVPARKSRPYSLGTRTSAKGGMLTYHPEVLENHRQMALDLDEQRDSEADGSTA